VRGSRVKVKDIVGVMRRVVVRAWGVPSVRQLVVSSGGGGVWVWRIGFSTLSLHPLPSDSDTRIDHLAHHG
jgi:hypothetical protein